MSIAQRILLTIALLYPAVVAGGQGVYMANGIKIGEVAQDSAIVWTRLTEALEGNADGIPFPNLGKVRNAAADKTTAEMTGGHALAEMEGSVPGAPGFVRVVWWAEQAPDVKRETPWAAVDAQADFTRQFPLGGLAPATQYALRAEGRATADGPAACSVEGRFRTAPAPETAAPVRFVVVTCQDYPRRDDPKNGHKIYDAMLELDPDFFVHTGDIEYYDKAEPYAPNRELARFKWNRLYAMPFQRAFHRNVSSFFIKDDHDTLRNDCWPGQSYGELTWEQGLAIFREQVPMGEKTYRTVRWGRDVQVWLVEGRDFRSPNTMRDGPEKSIWGPEQKAWFKKTVQESDATFRVLISPTPLVGPDRENKNDNHANRGFTYEGNELRRFIAGQDGMITINGDRHWQYESVDDDTGLYEFGTGPSSDCHAGGWDASDFRPEHRYLNLKGGFLEINVQCEGELCKMTVRHRGVNGEAYHEETFTRAPLLPPRRCVEKNLSADMRSYPPKFVVCPRFTPMRPIEDRPNVCLGTGALPCETRPENVRMLMDCVSGL